MAPYLVCLTADALSCCCSLCAGWGRQGAECYALARARACLAGGRQWLARLLLGRACVILMLWNLVGGGITNL